MTKLNAIQYNPQDISIKQELSLNSLSDNSNFEKLKQGFLSSFNFQELNTFSFCKDGFLGLLLELGNKGKLAISKGETWALVDAGKMYESLGFDIAWIELEKNGKISLNSIEKNDFDFLFISSYVMDTFVKTDLRQVKKLTKAKLISNASVEPSKNCDAIYFDPYKLTGFSTSGVLLFRDEIFEKKNFGFLDAVAVKTVYEGLKNKQVETSIKEIFVKKLKEIFKDDIYFFVNPNDTLEFTLHFGLKNIKARYLIRTLGFEDILISNGEGCSLGFSKPSRIIEQMGYSEDESRNAISLSFSHKMDEISINRIVKIIFKKYQQIRAFND